MSATIVPSPAATRAAAPADARTGRGWALAGAVAGLVFVPAAFYSWTVGGYETAQMADSAIAVEALATGGPQYAVLLAASAVAAAGLLWFAAGLRQRLVEQGPAGSLAPTLAGSGLTVTAALMLVGTGMTTELFSVVTGGDPVDPDLVASWYHLIGTLPFVWGAAGVSMAATAAAALRHGALPRWIGWTSAVLAVPTLILMAIPLQYLSFLPVCLWLVIVGVGVAAARRAH